MLGRNASAVFPVTIWPTYQRGMVPLVKIYTQSAKLILIRLQIIEYQVRVLVGSGFQMNGALCSTNARCVLTKYHQFSTRNFPVKIFHSHFATRIFPLEIFRSNFKLENFHSNFFTRSLWIFDFPAAWSIDALTIGEWEPSVKGCSCHRCSRTSSDNSIEWTLTFRTNGVATGGGFRGKRPSLDTK